jgi:hypothetical protein
MESQIREAGLGGNGFQEQVMEQAGNIIAGMLSGNSAQVHQLSGVQLAAMAIAHSVINEGAGKLCRDFDVRLDNLKFLAASSHISGC